MDFRTPLDIANRTCQLLGVRKIGLEGFNEDSVQADELGIVYDKMRRIELRRNLWTPSIKHAVLRAVGPMSRLMQPVLWSSTTTYALGAIVSDVSGVLWISKLPTNLGRGPGYDASAWEPYFGPLAVPPYDTTGGTAYWAGEVVYTYAGDGTYAVYLSLISSNSDNPATPNAYDPTITYVQNQVVTFNSVNYQSRIDLNLGQEPDTHPAAWTTVITQGTGSFNWLPILCALSPMFFVYPLGTGQNTDASTRNVFYKPANWLRDATQFPKQGSMSWLGVPSNPPVSDYVFEDDFIISSSSLIIYRFGADLADVSKFDPEMCEGLALRMGVATGWRITQSHEKLAEVKEQYQKFMTEARLSNGIEQGPEEPALDDFIMCRI